MYSFVLREIALLISVNPIWFITSVSFTLSLFSFCFNGLSINESKVLESPMIIVWGSMCVLSFNKVSVINVSALEFEP